MSRLWCRARRSMTDLAADCRGIAATEFAVIAPVMLLTFFAIVELTAGVAIDRKVTMVARTLSDLVSQVPSVTDADLQNVFAASYGILMPYSSPTAKATVSEIYVDNNGVAKVKWTKAATVAPSGDTIAATFAASSRNVGDTVALPAGLTTAGNPTYLIMSEFSYLYQPAIGYVVAKAGVTLSDQTYTRPRQSQCVLYGTQNCPTN
jgi:Flp pilus assembly protein TadG